MTPNPFDADDPRLFEVTTHASGPKGTLPLTPGGLGFVEAGLTGTLALAGVGAGAAVVATLAYRLVSFWLPIPAGGVAAVIHKRRFGDAAVEALEEGAAAGKLRAREPSAARERG